MEEKDREERRDIGLLPAFGGWLWHFFSSVRLAFVLMLVIIALSLVGALLMQAPPEVAADPVRYDAWLVYVAQPKFGAWAPFLSTLKLFDVFHSPWFLEAGLLLTVNILVCTLNRWKRLRRVVAGGLVRQPDAFYVSSTNQAELADLTVAPAEAVEQSSHVLKRHGYRVRTENFQDKLYLAADKNRHFRLGTYLSHLSLILFILGYLIGSYLGFRNTAFIVPEGTVRDVGYGTDLSLRLESFVDEYYPDGTPKDYRSEAVIYKAGEEVKRGTVRVNYPISYEGVRFFQSFFGPSAMIQVRGDTGEILYRDGVPLSELVEGKTYQLYLGYFSLPDPGLDVHLFSSAMNVYDPILKKGELALRLAQGDKLIAVEKLEQGVPRKIAGLEFTFLKEGKYSGFQVSHDPSNVLIWIASVLFLLGVGMVLYFPHRQVWALAQPQANGGNRLLVRSTTARGFGSASELQGLLKAIKSELAAKMVRRQNYG